ncbi:oxaloacetate decarboxylase [Reyranella sp. CPCC 100927]|uniref:isocitrate lyase/PEP mutase family protein n=1 Tax=Reyranella sp. CPCC 100927 TaxID=2599616 RepID=UPI0011B6F85F|nr:isocitrate lyase/phosphoenolpyruvate mutase family protein [Reyranella sp. CPCC 100927]TWT14111.1 isocitrate lyase/phosphoenolpyruvate mutase family protein [Reyranella sp. CPCC 100927]
MTTTPSKTAMQKAVALKALHQQGKTFIIPNPWDRGSARLLAKAGFPALATTSAGCDFARGVMNGGSGRDEILANAVEIDRATDLPVSADLEHGYGDAVEDVAETIRRAIAAGLAGGSIEDSTGNAQQPIYGFEHAVERMRAAVDVVKSQPIPFQLVARAENYLHGRPDLRDTIRRLQAFQEAGADVLYAPGLTTKAELKTLVSEVDRPVNVVMGLVSAEFTTVADLAALGVVRISLGSALARRAYGALIDAAREMAEQGSFAFADDATPFREINNSFAS